MSDQLACQYCGKVAKSVQGRIMHETKHCPKRPSAAPDSGEQAEGGPCKHTYKLLNPAQTDHARAMNAGFTKFCGKCGDLK